MDPIFKHYCPHGIRLDERCEKCEHEYAAEEAAEAWRERNWRERAQEMLEDNGHILTDYLRDRGLRGGDSK